jgi:hypothetical protein
MTLKIEDCRMKIHELTIEQLSIGAAVLAAGCCALAQSNRQSAIDILSIFNLQSPVGNDVWAS